MKKKLLSMISGIIVFGMLLGTNVYMAASTGGGTITLLKNQVWNVRPVVERSGKYYNTNVCCIAVYPRFGGEDNYTRIKVAIRDTDWNVISEEKTLYEDGGNYVLNIKNGELDHLEIRFAFCGNNPNLEAKADVSYDAK